MNHLQVNHCMNNASDYQKNALYYIAGYIVYRLIDRNNCTDCCKILSKNDYSQPDHMHFLSYVNMGKLYYPSSDTFKLVCFFHSASKQIDIVKDKAIENIINLACIWSFQTLYLPNSTHPLNVAMNHMC